MKLNWNNLNKEERATYMRFQTASGGGRSAYLPDDCYECPACGEPELGSIGLCRNCSTQWERLRNKLCSSV